METKLYHHKTDGGAKYLCTQHVDGCDEGDLRYAIVRLDGCPTLLGPTSHMILAAETAKLRRQVKELREALQSWVTMMDAAPENTEQHYEQAKQAKSVLAATE